MKVSAITSDGDWTLGRGLNSYQQKSAAIRQMVITNLRSFTNDWFLNMEFGTDWILLLSKPNNEKALIRAVERSILLTQGVRSVDDIEPIPQEDRKLKLYVKYTDVYNTSFVINEIISL